METQIETRQPARASFNNCLVDYYRCPEKFAIFALKGSLPEVSGYFQFGEDVTCFGRHSELRPSKSPSDINNDSKHEIQIADGTVHLPFDPSEVVENLRLERYVEDWWRKQPTSTLAKMYYLIRPVLPVGVRRHLQTFHLKGWEKLIFPRWPVDSSVDNLHEELMLLALRASGRDEVPFIWFWPDSASGCAIVTHDVETLAGRDSCTLLMDIDDAHGIKSSFQIIPEQRYHVRPEFLSSIRARGFEVLVHDLNHDGHLYRNLEQFRERVTKINAYGKKYRADGFRAGVLYRKQLWYEALDFAYDMSVPNVAHLDPQRGGCCTIMPYFIGNILELPVTTTQDYTLFKILNRYSTDIWREQIDLILQKCGLLSFIVHPDYIIETRARTIYRELLGHLSRLREEKNIWITLPGEVNRWWRQRAKMRLVQGPEGWRIEGEGAARATIAYASEKNGRLFLAKSKCGGQAEAKL